MAEVGASMNDNPRSNRGGQSGRGGRGNQDNNRGSNARGNSNGRGPSFRGRGTNSRGRGKSQRGSGSSDHQTHSDSGQPPGQSRLASAANSTAATNAMAAAPTSQHPAQLADSTDDTEGEVCFICASKIDHISIAPCNHQTCHICALRLRALYKTRACAHCRTEASFVIFTDDPTKRFEDFSDADFAKTDDNLGIKYEKEEIFEDTVLLLRYNCPDKDCDVACLGWPHLHRHVKAKHGKVMCDLCTRHKKVFTHEHELFSFGELRKHERFGDDNPGAIDQSGFKGHPECGFCRERFYGDDELYIHCREKHEKCHICDRRNNGRQPQYYMNYDALEEHFRKDHFLCFDQECLAKKFVVFESEMDLKAHQLSDHPNGLTKDARRDARLVDMSSFDYRAPYQPQRGGRREGRGGAGRGRDPNSEPLPMSSAQSLRRDELAYQRQMAIQSAQSVSTRNFGGQLTQSVNPPPSSSAPRPPQPLPAIDNLSITESRPSANLTPQEQARQLRHNAVMDRASNLLGNDALKLTEFRNKVSSYKNSKISATNLIDAFFSLFDTSSTELGKLIKELAEIYENETKRADLLKAWNDWRAINEDYPSLPGPNGTVPGMDSQPTNSSGRRVLRLKSSTAQSSRSAVGRQGSWGNAIASGNPFPPLGGSSNSGPSGTAGRKPAPWGAAPQPSRTNGSSSTSTAKPLRAGGPSSAGEAFPALPTTNKPNVLMAGLTKGTIRWDDRRNQAPSVNAWGVANSASDSGNATPARAASPPLISAVSEEGATTGAKKKGKKGKGQVLYQWG